LNGAVYSLQYDVLNDFAPISPLVTSTVALFARMSVEEIAFYDAPAQNESAIEVLGNETLRVIAHELLQQLRQNATVDWHKRESARARMRVLVKRILKKYGYPPDLAEDAVKLVLEQAEAILRQIS
jgi:type I restriction enzyme R subunit